MSFPARHPTSVDLPRTFGGTPMLAAVNPARPDRSTGAGSRRWTDRRIPALLELAWDPRTAIVSVDCFDTILWRRVAQPTDVFAVLGEELHARGLLDPGLNPRGFGRLRSAAEVVARQRKHARTGSSQVDLGEIYAELPDYVSTLSRAQLRASEVALERRLTVPDHELCEVLASLGPGIELIVVSDTYLSAAELTTLIDRPGVGALAHARVFTSCDLGTGRDADLWRRLSARLGVAPESVVHLGHDLRADVTQPGAAGVRALHWAERSDRLGEVLRRETDLRIDRERDGGEDRGVTALRGRARFSRYAGPRELEPAWQAGVEILGPVLSGYADWVLDRTTELGIDRAICVMPQGRFWQRLFDEGRSGSPSAGLERGLLWTSAEDHPALAEVIGDRPGEVAVLDIGRQGAKQERLQQIIDGAGLGVRLHGLYLSAEATPLDRQLRGQRIESFLPPWSVGSGFRQPAFLHHRVVLETLLSGEGSPVELRHHGVPALSSNPPRPNRLRPDQVALTDAVQTGIIAFRRHVGSYRAAGAGPDTARISGRDARTLLDRFIGAPTRAEAEVFGAILHDGPGRSLV